MHVLLVPSYSTCFIAKALQAQDGELYPELVQQLLCIGAGRFFPLSPCSEGFIGYCVLFLAVL